MLSLISSQSLSGIVTKRARSSFLLSCYLPSAHNWGYCVSSFIDVSHPRTHLVSFFIAGIEHWPQTSWGRKCLFGLHIPNTVISEGGQPRNSCSPGTQSQELQQSPWRSTASHGVFALLALLPSLDDPGPPAQSGLGLLTSVKEMTHGPVWWWKELFPQGCLFPHEPRLCKGNRKFTSRHTYKYIKWAIWGV